MTTQYTQAQLSELVLSQHAAISALLSDITSTGKPHYETLLNLFDAHHSLEDAAVISGEWTLECVLGDDLNGIHKLLKKGIKRATKKSVRPVEGV